jgi:hypothetical protein
MTTNSTDKIRNDNVILTETCKQLFGYILETKDNNVIVDELKSILKLSAVPTGRYKTVFKHILKMRENGEEINILSLGDSLNKTDELEQFGGLSTVASLTTGILPMGSIKHSVSRIKRAARDHANKEAIEKYADNPTNSPLGFCEKWKIYFNFAYSFSCCTGWSCIGCFEMSKSFSLIDKP